MKLSIRQGLPLTLLLVGVSVGSIPLLSPNDPLHQFRNHSLHPPTALHWSAPGSWTPTWPYFVLSRLDPTSRHWRKTDIRVPIALFEESETSVPWIGFTWRRRAFTSADPDQPLFLLGSDSLGRDLFSRVLSGASRSFTMGIVGVVVALIGGIVVGSLAAYCGGLVQILLMRWTDLLLSIPGLFLILAFRALLPVELSMGQIYWAMIFIFGLFGSAQVARVVRGQMAALMARDHVLAARAFGASHFRILWVHTLPGAFPSLFAQASILLPAFVVGEVSLSFLGLGTPEPYPSLGTLLADAASIHALTRYPWLLAPGFVLLGLMVSWNACLGNWNPRLKGLTSQR